MLPKQPIKLSNSDEGRKKCGELFNEHFCEIKIQLSLMRQQRLLPSTVSIIRLWKLYVAIATKADEH